MRLLTRKPGDLSRVFGRSSGEEGGGVGVMLRDPLALEDLPEEEVRAGDEAQ